MVTLRTRNIVDRRINVVGGAYCIYVVHDGETVFYVGQSAGRIFSRLREHLPTGPKWRRRVRSPLARLIDANRPQSWNWQVTLMTLEDCARYVELPDSGPALTLDQAEVAMIHHHRPCLNDEHNPRPLPLPQKYRYDKGR